MHNLGNIISFEIIRTLKKPTFWISAILMPVLIVGAVGLSTLSGYQSGKAAEEGIETEDLTMAIMDESEMINPELISQLAIKNIENKEAGIDEVKNGSLNVFYFIPKDLESESIEIYSQSSESSIFENYGTTIDTLLKQSAISGVDKNQAIVLNNGYNVSSTTYKNGEEYNIFGEVIVPIVALVIFYLLICMFGNQMMTSTTEEKENRVTEMILTSTTAKSLIVGKIISLIALGFLQLFILCIPLIIGYMNADSIMIGEVSLGSLLPEIVLDPVTITISLLLLIFGYLLFTGVLVMVGSLMPTAKEANGYFSVVIIIMFLPMFFINTFMTTEPNMVRELISFFPLSAPIALMMRSAFGTLTMPAALAGISILAVSSVFAITAAVRIFKNGALEFSSKLKLSQAVKK